MDQTAQQIREEHSGSSNETPELAGGDSGGDGDVDGGGGGIDLPVPSISRKHMAVIGAVVVLIVAWKLYQRKSSSSGGSISKDREQLDKSREIEAKPDEQEEENYRIPQDPSDPLAADRTVTEILRKNGKLREAEDGS